MMKFKEYCHSIESLEEMATVCAVKLGFGFKGVIWSNDHNPPHIHISTPDNHELTRILLIEKCPQTIDDVKIMKGDKELDQNTKSKIVKWANSTMKSGTTRWEFAFETWELNNS